MSIEKMTAVVWIVFAGVCFAAFYAFYQKRIVGDLLRCILNSGADCPENAKTLSEIGYGSGMKRRFAERLLKKGSVLRKSVEATAEQIPNPTPHNPDELFVKKEAFPADARFYVPTEKRPVAEIRYDEKGTTVSTLVLSIAAFFATAVIIIALLPWFSDRIRNFGRTETADKSESTQVEIEPNDEIEENETSARTEDDTISKNSENPNE